MAGAGISTAAGIPDFRTPGTGLYATLDKYDLPYPEAIFDIGYFTGKPEPFYKLYEELYPDGIKYKPTLTHTFFRLLHEKGKLLRVFTQNSACLLTVDALERLAGMPSDMLVEAHGTFATARCTRCHRAVDNDWLRERVKSGLVARCEKAGCDWKPPIKPDITCASLLTVFGENLPERFFDRIPDLYRADLLLVMGTSLVVQPFASLVGEVSESCPRALFNLERVGVKKLFNLARLDPFYTEAGFDFNSKRDTFCKGYVDDTVRLLAQKCGWQDELNTMHDEMMKRFSGDVDSLADALSSVDIKEAKGENEKKDTGDKTTAKMDDSSKDAADGAAKAATKSNM